MSGLPQRKSQRWKDYDYHLPGNYFITICAKNRHPWFGEIVNQEVVLSEAGLVIQQQWQWLGEKYSDCLVLDQFVVMPDHVHGIMSVINTRVGHDRPLQRKKIKPLPELVGAFKTTSSKLIHQSGHPNFAWQRSFHDRIIRNDLELQRIRHYIFHNPHV